MNNPDRTSIRMDPDVKSSPENLYTTLNKGLLIFPKSQILTRKSRYSLGIPDNGYKVIHDNMKRSLLYTDYEFITQLLVDYKDTIFIAGGYCSDMIRGNLKFEDIDFFFHRKTGTFKDNIVQNIKILKEIATKVDKYNHHFNSIEGLLKTFDIDAACIALTHNSVIIGDRAKVALTKGYNAINHKLASGIYDSRLDKYFNVKGFGLYFPDFDLSKVDKSTNSAVLEITLPKLKITLLKPKHFLLKITEYTEADAYFGTVTSLRGPKVKIDSDFINAHNVNVKERARSASSEIDENSKDSLLTRCTYGPCDNDIILMAHVASSLVGRYIDDTDRVNKPIESEYSISKLAYASRRNLISGYTEARPASRKYTRPYINLYDLRMSQEMWGDNNFFHNPGFILPRTVKDWYGDYYKNPDKSNE